MRTRLTVTVVSALALVLGPAAFAGPGPATTISAAATAIDASPLDVAGNVGPCALALVASGSDHGFTGEGSFTASGGTGMRAADSTCGGGPSSLRFAVVRARASQSRAVLHVRVTASDRPREIGQPGTIVADAADDEIRVEIASHDGRFGRSSREERGLVARRAEVQIATVNATAVTSFTGTGTSVDVDTDMTEVVGDCAIAIAGTQLVPADRLLRDGGTFTTIVGDGASGATTRTCLGGLADFRFVLEGLTTDGESTAVASVRVSESDAGPAPGLAGAIAIDEANQVVAVRLRRQTAVFGPGRTVVGRVVETRAGATVETHLLTAA
jgi:hypothetical protein